MWTEQNLDADWKPPPPKKTSEVEATHLPLSYLPVEQHISDSVRQALATESEASSPGEYRPEVHLRPDQCKCGEKWKSFDELYTMGTYYTSCFKKNIPVYVRKCVTNKCSQHFDGQSTGVFNYSGETLVSYAVMQDYFHCCIRGGMSWAAFLNKMNCMYNNVFTEQAVQMPFMSTSTFSKVCIWFLQF